MALTSRAPKYRAATEHELENKKIYFELAALTPVGQDVPTYREVKGRELSYMKGIMMTSGMNKGEMLKYILEKTNKNFNAIVFVFVFVDDSKKNIDAVYSEYKDRVNVDVKIFHYTNIKEQRRKDHGSVLTRDQAIKMDTDWKKLNATLNTVFPNRNISSGCLNLN